MYYYSPFRKHYDKSEQLTCVFCDPKWTPKNGILRKDGSLFESTHWKWIVNLYPKFEGHTMLAPKRHFTDLIEETADEAADRQMLFKEIVPILKTVFPSHGIEYFAQNGSGSESSVAHVHWHVVPASPDDELRSFEKLGHYYTIEPEKEKVVLFPKEISMSPEALRAKLSE